MKEGAFSSHYIFSWAFYILYFILFYFKAGARMPTPFDFKCEKVLFKKCQVHAQKGA